MDAGDARQRPRCGRRYQPRTSSRSLSASDAEEMPTIGSPRPGRDLGQDLRVLEVRGRLDDRLRAQVGVARLEDARADEDAVGAELHAERRVGGGRDAAGGEGDDRQPAVLGHPAHELVRRLQVLRLGVQLVAAQRLQPPDAAEDGAHVRDGVDDVARSGLTLGADHRGALADAAQRLAEVRGAADERHREAPLVDVMLDVGRRQHLGLVDVVDLERLQDLRLGEMADPALGHHGNRDGLLDLADHARVGHARDAAVAADVGRHALERHHGARRPRSRRSRPARR